MSIEAKRAKRLLAGVLAGALALSVTPILGFTGTANALEEPTGDGSVCEDAPEAEPFTDVSDADPSNEEIECLSNTGITKGKTATTYEPNSFVQRRSMALFLVRLADVLEANEVGDEITELPAGDGETTFTDIGAENEETQDAIDRLNDAGIALGTTATTFSPGDNVTREQMAAFIVRLQRFTAGEDAPADGDTDAFTDDDDSFAEEQLNILAEEEVYRGVGGGVVNPGDPITRRQMANVIIRKAQWHFEAGDIERLFEENDGNAAATSRPELISATIVQTNNQGTVVRYTFDEALTGTNADATDFHVYSFGWDGNGNGYMDSGSGTPQVVASNTSQINVLFTGIDPTEAPGLSVATVDEDAVFGVSGAANEGNIIGDAPLNPGTTSNLVAGQTTAPDLVSVGNFRANPGNVNQTLVDFTFDEAAWADGDGYDLVNVDGVNYNDDGVLVSGDGTTVHTVAFENNGFTGGADSTVLISPTIVARGVIYECYVYDNQALTGNCNPLQAADVSNGGNSETPDLVSAVVAQNQPNPLFGQPLQPETIDVILYTFDEPVLTPGSAPGVPGSGSGYYAYLSNSDQLTAVAATRSTSNDTQVAAVFGPGGTLNTVVGASIEYATLEEGTGGQNRDNQEDEVAIANVPSGVTTTSGRTAGPDLIDVTVAERRDGFGTLIGARVTYTFDEDVVLADASALSIVLADGTDYQCSADSATGTTEDTDNTVRCDTFGAATTSQILSAAVGTVDDGAVNNQDGGTPAVPVAGGETNVEGAEVV